MSGELFISAKNAARRLGLTVNKLAKKRGTGDGPAFHKFGRSVFYSLTDLDAWAAARRYTSTSAVSAKVQS
jgi:hypothetical protein